VPVKVLDNINISSQNMIVKIDVEGFETEVVKGGEKIIKSDNCYAVIMELNGCGEKYGFDEDLLHRKMLNFGFFTFRYQPFEHKLISLNGARNNSGNTLYIKHLELFQKRLASAKKFYVNGQYV